LPANTSLQIAVELVPLNRLLPSGAGEEQGYLDDAGSLLALQLARLHLDALRHHQP
jgi:hypothetical protein